MLNAVMCVDDDSVTIMLCKIVIKKSLFANNIIAAENGQKALDYFDKQLQLPAAERQLPQLILLDLNMPVIDGWGFLDAFLEKFTHQLSSIPIAILSSSINPADAIKAKNYPAVFSFLPKPLSTEQLQELTNREEFKAYFSN